MDNDYAPTPAARLIEERRTKRGLSVRKAAASAGLSEGRWRQIAKGYQQAAAGVRVPVNTPTETLVRMAGAVGVTGDEMFNVERAVADMIRSQSASRLRHPSAADADGQPADAVSQIPNDVLLAELARRLGEREELMASAEHTAPIVAEEAESLEVPVRARETEQGRTPQPRGAADE